MVPVGAPSDSVGVEPSVVKKIFALAVASEIATLCAAVNEPPGGLNVGVATVTDGGAGVDGGSGAGGVGVTAAFCRPHPASIAANAIAIMNCRFI